VATDERIRKYRHPIPRQALDKHAELCWVGATKLVTSCTRLVHFGELPAELVTSTAPPAPWTPASTWNPAGVAVKDIFRQAVETYAATATPRSGACTIRARTGYGPRTYIGGLKCPEVCWRPGLRLEPLHHRHQVRGYYPGLHGAGFLSARPPAGRWSRWMERPEVLRPDVLVSRRAVL